VTRVPGTQSDRQGEAILWYASEQPAVPLGGLSEVVVDQDHDPDGKALTTCASNIGETTEMQEVDGTRIATIVVPGSDGTVVHSMRFWTAERCVFLHMLWKLDGGIEEFTDDMNQEGLKVAKSLLSAN
jgi:hypothetical protein